VISISNEKEQQVKDLRLNMNEAATTAQFTSVRINREAGE